MDKDENAKENETAVKTDTIENKLSGNGAGKQAEADVEDPTPFAIIEEQPLFPGGTDALLKYLGENIKYPAKAKEAGISGTVIMSFIIEKDGTISNVKVFRGLGGGCNEEAIRVVSKMPRWSPGRQHNQPVRVQFHIPLNFFLRAK
jgi:protein TonB